MNIFKLTLSKKNPMSILNKLVNYVTGGSAEVHMNLDEATLKKPFNAKVKAKIFRDTIKVERVYILIRCLEGKLIEFEAKDDRPLTDNEKILNQMKEWNIKTIAEVEHIVSGRQKLAKDEIFEWETTIDLTKQTKLSVNEDKYFIKWEAQAGLDVPGNDPDSGWQEFKVG